jgi:6-phosphogluconolactonase
MPRSCDAFVGTYTSQGGRGIHRLSVDADTGEILSQQLAAQAANPSFLALHSNGRFLYTANELFEFSGKPSGAVSSFLIERFSGRLSPINQVESGGALPAHLGVDRSGKNLLLANYQGPQSAIFRLNGDGSIGARSSFVRHSGRSIHPTRQTEAHPHSLNLDPGERFVLVPDLGTDQILVYHFDPSKGTLQANKPAFIPLRPGSGPRHLAFDPSGKFAYVTCELSSEIASFSYDGAAGGLAGIQTLSILPPSPAPENFSAEVAVHPSGRFLYASVRGSDVITVMAIDPSSGMLSIVQHVSSQGRTPRHFAIDPAGRFMLVANQRSHSVAVLRIAPDSGRLAFSGSVAEISAPAFILFLPN